MEGRGAFVRLPLTPPFFFESAVNYDATSGAGTLATGFAELKPLDKPSGQVRAWDPNLRPQFTQQWNVFVERLLTPSTSANVGYVGHNAKHLVTPVEGNQPLPGVGDLRGAVRQRAHVGQPGVWRDGRDPRRLEHQRHPAGTDRLPHYRHRWQQSFAAGAARQ